MRDVDLSPATPDDADEIARIHPAARADALPYLPRLHAGEEVRAWIAGVVLPRCQVWIARRGRTAVGFALLDGENLGQLYVLPGHTRQGVGSLLLMLAKSERPGRLHLFTCRRGRRVNLHCQGRAGRGDAGRN